MRNRGVGGAKLRGGVKGETERVGRCKKEATGINADWEEEEEEAVDESSARSIKRRNNSVETVIAPQRPRQGFRRGGGRVSGQGADPIHFDG